MGLLLIVGPMFAAGRGLRPFLLSLGTGWGIVVLLAAANGRATLEVLADWRDNLDSLLMIAVLFGASVVMGGLVLMARHIEERRPTPGRCRRCGYDLRSSPDRCPECGTPVRPVRPGPERV